MNRPVYVLCVMFTMCTATENENEKDQNDFLSLQLLIMSGIAGKTFKSIIRAGRLVLIKRQTT